MKCSMRNDIQVVFTTILHWNFYSYYFSHPLAFRDDWTAGHQIHIPLTSTRHQATNSTAKLVLFFCMYRVSHYYQILHFFNNSKTNEDTATKQAHTTDTFLFISHAMNVLLFKSRCNIFTGFRIIKEMPGLVGSGTPCILFAGNISSRSTSIKTLRKTSQYKFSGYCVKSRQETSVALLQSYST